MEQMLTLMLLWRDVIEHKISITRICCPVARLLASLMFTNYTRCDAGKVCYNSLLLGLFILRADTSRAAGFFATEVITISRTVFSQINKT